VTYGDGLETKVEDTRVEDGCTGVADEEGFGADEEDGLTVDEEDGLTVDEEDDGFGLEEGVGVRVGVGVGVGCGVAEGVGRTVVVVFLVVVVVVVYPLVTVAVAVPDLKMLLQNRSASEVWPSNASRPQSSTGLRVSFQCRIHSGILGNDCCN
jgi:hypothetical protein